MKSMEELNAIRNEIETLNKKLAELTEDELQSVVGGLNQMLGADNPFGINFDVEKGKENYEFHEYEGGIVKKPEDAPFKPNF